MRVLVLGSLPDHVPGTNQPVLASHAPLFKAGRAIGWALAADDFRAIVGSSSPRTIDPYVFEGFAEYCRENPSRQRHIEVQFPVDANNPGYEPHFVDIPENLHVLKIENYADASSPHRWIVSHFAALRSADILLTLGGGVSTCLLGSYPHQAEFRYSLLESTADPRRRCSSWRGTLIKKPYHAWGRTRQGKQDKGSFPLPKG